MGDAILAIFGSPVSDPEHHEHAILAAIEMQTAIAKLNETRRFAGLLAPRLALGCTAVRSCMDWWVRKTGWSSPSSVTW